MSTHTTDSPSHSDKEGMAHFAGQPRHTRDPELLEGMMREIDEILVANRELSDGLADEMTQSLAEDRKLYENEIGHSRRAGALYEYQTWVWLTIGRYRRNFAGQSFKPRHGSFD